MLVALLATLGIWYVFKDETPPPPPQEETEKEEPVKEEDQVATYFDIQAQIMDEYGVHQTSSFKIETNAGVTVEQLKSHLIVEPTLEFDVEKIDDQAYLMTPKTELTRNTVYVLKYEPFDYGKAFQVTDGLKLLEKYPGSDSYDVPADSVIELYFNSKDVVDLESYFDIEPSVEGEFQYDNDKVTFVPTHFNYGTRYTVTLKKGLSDGEKDLGDDVSFSFVTGYSNDFNDRVVYTIKNVTPNEVSMISNIDYNQSSSYHMTIYQVASFDDFKSSYETIVGTRGKLSLDDDVIYEEDIQPVIFQYKDFFEVPALESGRYIVETKNDNGTQYTFLQVDDLQFYYLQTKKGELVWAMNHVTKLPAKDVMLFNGDEHLGSTSSDGILTFDNQEQRSYVMKQDDRSYLLHTLNDNYYFDYWYEGSNDQSWSFLYTDRPAYLPNDRVEIFGFVRNFNDEPVSDLTVTIKQWWDSDEKDKEIAVELMDHQTFSASFDLNDFEPGYYSVQLKSGDTLLESKEIIVTVYEKPEVLLTSAIDKKVVKDGDSLTYTVFSNYFNELPFEGLEVEVYQQDNDNIFLTTDEEGQASTTFEINSSRTDWRPYFHNITSNNVSLQNTYLSTHDSVEVFPRDIMITMDHEIIEDELFLDIQTHTIVLDEYDGRFGENYEHIKGEIYDKNYTLFVQDIYTEKTFVETRINPIHKVSYDVYDYQRKTSEFKLQGTTIEGVDRISFPVEEGHYYKIKVITEDQAGRRTTADSWYGRQSYYYEEDMYTLSLDDYGQYYDIGQIVNYQVLKNASPIEDTREDYLLNLTLRNGLLDYEVADLAEQSFVFEEKHRPNIWAKAVYYDGYGFTILPKWSSLMLGYDYETLEATIDYELDKTDYQPGDEATIKLSVSREGVPFNGVVNVSIVDEAYFALYEDYFDLGSALHSYIYDDGVLVESMSFSESTEGMNGAEAGEGGDGAYIRDEFKDTAYFKQIEIVDGQGMTTIKLPDNLTQWRITLHAVNESLEYSTLQGKLNVTLPYFVRNLSNYAYVTGDEVQLTVSSDGESIDKTKQIGYKGQLLKGGLIAKEVEVIGVGKNYAHLPMGVLEQGDFSVVIEGATDGYIDGIKQDIKVRDHYLETIHKRSTELTNDYMLKYDRQTKLTCYNQAARDYLSRVVKAAYRSNHRLEEIIGGRVADDMLAVYFDVNTETIQVTGFQSYDGGLRPLLTGDSSLETTTLVMGTQMYIDDFNKAEMIRYVQNQLESGSLLDETVARAYWSLAAQGEPVLIGIDRYLTSKDQLTSVETLYVAMALAELGDTTRAKELLAILLDSELKDLNASQKLLCGAYIKDLNMVYDLFDEGYSETVLSDDTLVLEKLFYIQKYPVTFEETSFAYTLNGVLTEVELPDLEPYSFEVKPGELLSFSDVGSDIVVDEWMTIYSTDNEEYKDDGLELKIDFESTVQFGDRLKVVYEYKKPSKSYPVILSRVPAGLEFVGSVDGGVYYDDQTISMYTDYNSTGGRIEVYFSAVQSGRYQFESSMLQMNYEDKLFMTKPAIIEVVHD